MRAAFDFDEAKEPRPPKDKPAPHRSGDPTFWDRFFTNTWLLYVIGLSILLPIVGVIFGVFELGHRSRQRRARGLGILLLALVAWVLWYQTLNRPFPFG